MQGYVHRRSDHLLALIMELAWPYKVEMDLANWLLWAMQVLLLCCWLKCCGDNHNDRIHIQCSMQSELDSSLLLLMSLSILSSDSGQSCSRHSAMTELESCCSMRLAVC